MKLKQLFRERIGPLVCFANGRVALRVAAQLANELERQRTLSANLVTV